MMLAIYLIIISIGIGMVHSVYHNPTMQPTFKPEYLCNMVNYEESISNSKLANCTACVNAGCAWCSPESGNSYCFNGDTTISPGCVGSYSSGSSGVCNGINATVVAIIIGVIFGICCCCCIGWGLFFCAGGIAMCRKQPNSAPSQIVQLASVNNQKDIPQPAMVQYSPSNGYVQPAQVQYGNEMVGIMQGDGSVVQVPGNQLIGFTQPDGTVQYVPACVLAGQSQLQPTAPTVGVYQQQYTGSVPMASAFAAPVQEQPTVMGHVVGVNHATYNTNSAFPVVQNT